LRINFTVTQKLLIEIMYIEYGLVYMSLEQ